MEIVNAVAKVRFGSAKPQCIQLHRDGQLALELLCMEPGQSFSAPGGRAYYVIAGQAEVSSTGKPSSIAAGQLALSGTKERHILTNTGENRLICLTCRSEA